MFGLLFLSCSDYLSPIGLPVRKPVIHEGVLREAMRQSRRTAEGQDRQPDQRSAKTPRTDTKQRNPTTEELVEGLENDPSEQCNEINGTKLFKQ